MSKSCYSYEVRTVDKLTEGAACTVLTVQDIINNDNEQFVEEYAYFRLLSTYSVAPHLAKDDTLIGENCIKVLHPNNILFSLDPDIIDFYLSKILSQKLDERKTGADCSGCHDAQS